MKYTTVTYIDITSYLTGYSLSGGNETRNEQHFSSELYPYYTSVSRICLL